MGSSVSATGDIAAATRTSLERSSPVRRLDRDIARMPRPHRRGLRDRFARLLDRADVRLDGARAWDPRIHDGRVFRKIFARGSLGLGESYVEGGWDCEQLDELVHRVL